MPSILEFGPLRIDKEALNEIGHEMFQLAPESIKIQMIQWGMDGVGGGFSPEKKVIFLNSAFLEGRPTDRLWMNLWQFIELCGFVPSVPLRDRYGSTPAQSTEVDLTPLPKKIVQSSLLQARGSAEGTSSKLSQLRDETQSKSDDVFSGSAEKSGKLKQKLSEITHRLFKLQTLLSSRFYEKTGRDPLMSRYSKAIKEFPDLNDPSSKFAQKLDSPRFENYAQAIRTQYESLLDQGEIDQALEFAKKRIARFLSIQESVLRSEVASVLAHEYTHARDLSDEKIFLQTLAKSIQALGVGGALGLTTKVLFATNMEFLNSFVAETFDQEKATIQVLLTLLSAVLSTALTVPTSVVSFAELSMKQYQNWELAAYKNQNLYPLLLRAVSIDQGKLYGADRIDALMQKVIVHAKSKTSSTTRA